MSEIARQRLDAQLLNGPTAETPEQVVGHLLAVQAQDPRGFRLALRARSTGLTAADVDRALDEGRLVVGWLNRGTLHLVRAEDYWDLFALTVPQQETGAARRLGQLDLGPAQVERAAEVLIAAVADGPRTRDELRGVLEGVGLPTAGQALVHLIAATSRRGLLVRGPMRGEEQAFVAAERWLGPRPRIDREDALRRLGERYLVGHGPADPRDLAKWAGLPLGQARRALDGLDPRADAPAMPLPPPRLLGAFDPLLHGWVDRGSVVGPHGDRITRGGMFRPFALAEGRAVATWGLRAGRVELEFLEQASDDVAAALDADAAAVREFLGLD